MARLKFGYPKPALNELDENDPRHPFYCDPNPGYEYADQSDELTPIVIPDNVVVMAEWIKLHRAQPPAV